jgi:multiple sugar transport system substrate-binding protein
VARLALASRAFDGFDRALARQAAAWDGGHVDVRPRELPDLEAAVVDGDALLDGSTDLALVPTDWLPSLVDRGAVLDLSDRLAADPPPDWPDGWSPSMRGLQARGDRVFGMPYHDGPMVLLYRADRYDDPAERAGFADRFGRPLAPPASWSDLADQAAWFTRPGLFGTVLAGEPDGHNDVYDFLLQLWSRGGHLARNGRAAFHEAPGVDGLAFLAGLRRGGMVDPASLGWDSVTSGEHFAAGEAALMVNWAGFAAMSAPPGSPTHGLVRCAPVPRHDDEVGSVSLNVYWVLVVAAGSEDPRSAYAFLRHLARPEMDLVTSLEGGTGVRLSTWRDERLRNVSPYYEVIEEVHGNVQSPPAVAGWPEAVRVLTRAIAAVVRDEADPAAALTEAATEVDRHGWLSEVAGPARA